MTSILKPARDAPTDLVVIVHGLRKRMLETVPPVVAERLPHADILLPTYEAGPLSNRSGVDLADEISDAIQSQCDRHLRTVGTPYQRIILIGHSRGALLVRKAYVFARGENQELWVGGLRPKPRPWAASVERIILLAGLNRGWSFSPKPPRMSWRRWALLRVLDVVVSAIGQARLLRDIKKGAPFIANLRVQWIRLSRQGPMPLTVQIRGDMDDLVNSSDNIDLQAGWNFVYLNAPRGTTHATVIELDDEERRAVFLRALEQPRDTLHSEYIVPDLQREDASVEQVVFIVHGIRDFGGWTRRLSAVLKERAEAMGRRLETVTSSYGYFPMFRFLVFSERQKNVRWFMDRYTEVLARYPNAQAIDFVGHSNGTYLLGSALRRYRACDFGRAVCAGSVLPRDFEWDDMVTQGRIRAIRNYLTTGDWVVGIFPNLFDRWGDIGGGGFLGFVREPAAGNEFHYVRGSHSAAISDENLGGIAQFLLDGALVPPPTEIRSDTQSSLVLLLSKFDWAIWLGLVAIAVGGAWLIALWVPFVPYASFRVAIFLGVLLALLNSA